jgi:hypothetical protein
VDVRKEEAPMPIFNEFIITKKSDIAWDGGKPTEDLTPHDGDLVFESTGGGGRSTGSSFDLVFPAQTTFPEVSGLKIEYDVIEFSESDYSGAHALYQDVMIV